MEVRARMIPNNKLYLSCRKFSIWNLRLLVKKRKYFGTKWGHSISEKKSI
jgi:hypothetical protein